MTSGRIPKHIAIIMDGNGRWATKRRLPRVAGHQRGVASVRRTVEKATKTGIEVLSLYCFSTENWLRPAEEVKFLMDTFLETLFLERQRLLKNNIRFKMIGDASTLDPKLVRTAEDLEAESTKNTGMWLLLAINYGGRQELVRAIKQIVHEKPKEDEINEKTISDRLYTKGLPEPDLIIRTSGEMRLSNFMLWQGAYAELVFIKKLWPDFNENDLIKAINIFSKRERRFGRTKGVA